MLVDQGIKMRLGEFGVIAFIMPVAAIADHVNKDIGVELLPVTGRDVGTFHDGFGVIAIDVQNRRLDGGGE